MQSLRLLLTMAVAASVHGQRSASAGRVIDNGIGEASSIRQARADQSRDGVGAVVDAIDRDHGDEQQPRIYVSQAESLLHILRNTEADRSSALSPPLHFEIEVDLSDESDFDHEDLSHFRRLQTTQADIGAKDTSTLLLQLSTVTPAISPSTTFNFKSVSFPQNTPSDKTDIASKLSILANDPAKTRGLSVLSVNTENGSVRGLQRGRSGSVRTLDMFTLRNGQVVEDAAAHVDVRKRIFMSPVVGKGKNQNFTCGVAHKEEWDDRMLFDGVWDEEWKAVRGRQDKD
ncbi:hypothetical protein ACHAW6_005118 [Cyclotella cf. meneghiniana]